MSLEFEDQILDLPEGADPPRGYKLPLIVTWALPPLPQSPDLLVLATDLAGVGGATLPLEVSAADAYVEVTDAPQRTLTIVSRLDIELDRIYLGQETLADLFERAFEVSQFLLDRAPAWLGEL